jgi:hypothetical protein
VIASVLICTSALAAASPSYAIEASRPTGVWLSADLGGGSVGDDVVAGIGIGVGVETVPFGLHVEVPLTLRVVDVAPTVSRALPSSCKYVRCEEWTDAGKVSLDAIARVVEELRVLRPGDVVHARGGRLFATLGRGQHVARYTNAAEWDRRGSGLYLEGNIDSGRTKLEGIAGRLLTPQDLLAVRVSSSPLAAEGALDDLGRFLGRMRVGIESAADLRAPVGLAIDASGALLPGSASRAIVGAAVDVGWPLLDGSDGAFVQVEPWISASAMSGLVDRPGGVPGVGAGGSAGLDVTVDAVVIALRASARGTLDGVRHRSALFSALYDVDRKRVLARRGAFATTGTAALAATGGAGGGGSLELIVMRAVRAGARGHVDPVPEATEIEAFAELATGPIFVGARAVQRALRSPSDALAFGDRTFVVAEGAWSAWPPISLFARWRHAPRFDGSRLATDDDVFAGASCDVLLE